MKKCLKIIDNRTLLPIRALVEKFGGSVEWNQDDKKVTIQSNSKTIELWIGKNTISVNGEEKLLEVAPQIINERTMLPLRAVAENMGLSVDWQQDTKRIIINNN